MTEEFDLDLDGGRVLHVYDTRDAAPFTVFWHHGTPNLGAPPVPLFDKRIRWVSYDRPGYGTSTPAPGRDVASAAVYTRAVADALGIGRFAVVGHSGGGPHALAVAALLPERVTTVVSGSALAPHSADGLDWFAGMAPGSVAALGSALRGRAARAAYAAGPQEEDIGFTVADWQALESDWAWVMDVVRPAVDAGPEAQVDDDLAYTAPWGFDPADVAAPTLILHGGQDRMTPPSHAEWLAGRIPRAELRIRPGDGHVSVLRGFPDALAWLTSR